jgi:hypothetical protein
MIMKPAGTIGMPNWSHGPNSESGIHASTRYLSFWDCRWKWIGQRWSINPERADHILSSTQNTHPTYRAGGIIWYTAGENYHWGTQLRIRIESVISGTSNGNGKLIAVNSNVAHVLVHGSRRSVNQSYWKFSGATIASCNRDRNPLVLSEYPKICLIVNLCRLSVKKYSVLWFLIPHLCFGIRLDINSWGLHKRAEYYSWMMNLNKLLCRHPIFGCLKHGNI